MQHEVRITVLRRKPNTSQHVIETNEKPKEPVQYAPSPATPVQPQRASALEVRSSEWRCAARPSLPEPHSHAETSRDTHGRPRTLLPDGILVHEALDARVAQTPEALGDELQAGRQVLHLGRVSAGPLDGVRRFLQDIQDSLEDSPGRRLSKKRIKLLQNKK